MKGTLNPRRTVGFVVVLLALFGAVGPARATDPPALPDDPPNIVMFYLDDVSPHDGSLWNDPTRTPNFVDHFIDHGVKFDHAIGEYPLCCPGRGNMLTGLHTHNNGVTANNGLLFDPSEHIGKAMKNAGYATMFIGKYLNRADEFTPEQWAAQDAGWTHLDVINAANGVFYNYRWHTKEGETRIKRLHSTQKVADDAIARFQQTPADKPLFAVLSIFNMHGSNIPLPQYVGDPRCANKAPWNTPAYNESDVSDKPAYIQALPLLPQVGGWPMVTYCREMLGIDHVIGQVTDELEAEGRLDNTLLVFTADNGMAWGAHRLGQKKIWPYTTPLPLYMSWPAAGWGSTPSTISELTSNIDLAPTFCELAQACVLGPFTHNTGPDGKSLVPLLTGSATNLGRDALLENTYTGGPWSWFALRTTALYDATNRWHYVEYRNGFRELYDLVADPWELSNLASDPGHAAVVDALHTRLGQLRMEGVEPGTGSIRITEDARPNTGADYTFSGDLGTFTLDDDSNVAHPNSMLFSDLAAGYYTVTRPDNLHSVLDEVSCDGVAIVDLAADSVTMLVRRGDAVSCTWIDVTRRPDASIALEKSGKYKANNYYTATPTKQQTVKRTGVSIGSVSAYYMRIQNDSGARDNFTIGATVSGPGTFSVAYLYDGTDVTSEVSAATFRVDLVQPQATRRMQIHVTAGPGTPAGSAMTVVLTVTSVTDPTVVDVVRAVTAR